MRAGKTEIERKRRREEGRQKEMEDEKILTSIFLSVIFIAGAEVENG